MQTISCPMRLVIVLVDASDFKTCVVRDQSRVIVDWKLQNGTMTQVNLVAKFSTGLVATVNQCLTTFTKQLFQEMAIGSAQAKNA